MGNNVSFSTRVRGEPGRGIEDDSEYQRTDVQDALREEPSSYAIRYVVT